MLFAGSLARTDRTTGGGIAQGPVGMIFGKIRGAEKSRIEPRISQMEHLSMERQVVTIIRNEDNDLCFVGSRIAGRRSERRAQVLHVVPRAALPRAAHRGLSAPRGRTAAHPRPGQGQVRDPIEEFLRSEKKNGTIYDFDLDIDMAEDKFAMGVLDIELEVLPVGPAETFKLKIDTPNFSKEEAK